MLVKAFGVCQLPDGGFASSLFSRGLCASLLWLPVQATDFLANGGFLEGLLVGFRALPASAPPLSVIKVPVVAVIILVRAEWDVAPRGIHSCYPSVSKVAAEACHPLLSTPELVSPFRSSSEEARDPTSWHGGAAPTGCPRLCAPGSFFLVSV